MIDAAGFFLVARRAFYLRVQLCVGGFHEEQLTPTLRIIFTAAIVSNIEAKRQILMLPFLGKHFIYLVTFFHFQRYY